MFKLFTHDGGIRTLFIAHWPARIAPGTENVKQTAHVKDILPTLLDAAEVKTATPDALPITGRSFLPALLDASHAANEPLFWERMGNSAVRDGDWKLVRFYNDARIKNVSFGPRTGAWQLFNLVTDPTESRDLAANESEKAAELIVKYAAWEQRIGVVPREDIVAKLKPESAR